jgi:hypothetical protein
MTAAHQTRRVFTEVDRPYLSNFNWQRCTPCICAAWHTYPLTTGQPQQRSSDG